MNTHRLDQAIQLGGITVRQDADGRYCINDLHDAAVANGRNKRGTEPGEFFRLSGTKALLELLLDRSSETTGNPRSLGSLPVAKIEGRAGGTFVSRQLVYSYASWISAKFYLLVLDTFDQALNGELRHLNQTERHFFEARPHWKQIREMALTGQKYSIIARQIGRSAGSVSRCVARMERVGLIDPVKHRIVRFKPATAQKLIATNQLCLEWGIAA